MYVIVHKTFYLALKETFFSLPRSKGKRFFVELGGAFYGYDYLVEIYDIEHDKWSDLGIAPRYFYYPNFLIHGDEMYLLSGLVKVHYEI